MQGSVWWWQRSDRYIISPFPSLPASNKPYGLCGREAPCLLTCLTDPKVGVTENEELNILCGYHDDWNSLDISINSKKNFPVVFLTLVVPANYRTRPLRRSNTVAINKTECGNVLLTTSSRLNWWHCSQRHALWDLKTKTNYRYKWHQNRRESSDAKTNDSIPYDADYLLRMSHWLDCSVYFHLKQEWLLAF